MKAIKVIFRYVIYLIIGLVIALALLPFIFKDEIVEEVKVAAANNLNATVDFSDISLSFFRSFPDLNVSVNDLTIDGIDAFDGTRLLATDAIEVGINLPSLWSETRPYEINFIKIVRPTIEVAIMADGRANYDISTSTDTSSTAYSLDLQKYEIIDGTLHYSDATSATRVTMHGVNHAGRGSFSDVAFVVDTETDIDQASVAMDNVTYLRKARLRLDAKLGVDQSQQLYTIAENELKINELTLRADGTVQMVKDGTKINLELASPSTAFSEVASIIPFVYDELRYQGIDAAGSGGFDAKIKGLYGSDGKTYPAVNASLKLADGQLAYSGSDHKISDVNVNASIRSTRSDLSDLTVDVEPFGLRVDGQPIAGKLHIKEALGATSANGDIKGSIDLAAVKATLNHPDIEALSGTIKADLTFDLDAATIQSGDIAGSIIAGELSATDLTAKTTDMQSLSIAAADMQFDNQTAQITVQDGQIGASDLSLDVTVDNLASYIVDNKTLIVTGKGRSKSVNLDEWMSTTDTSTTTTTPIDLSAYQVNVDYMADELIYTPYTLQDLKASGSLDDDALIITNGETKVGESDLAVKGRFDDLSSYLSGDGPLTGDIAVSSDRLVMRDFSTEADADATADEGVVPIPTDLEIHSDFNIGTFVYDDLVLQSMVGSLDVADQAAQITQASAKAMGGSMNFTGSYDTKDITEPSYAFKYNMNQIDFSKAYNTLAPIKAFVPIMRYVEGIFNSTLVMEGKLDKNMMPDLNSIDASGYIETLNGRLAGFQPVERLADKLSVDELKKLAIENTRNWITIKDGRLELKPQEIAYKEIDMVISGSHSLTTDMNYEILMQIPRTLLKASTVGAVADQGLHLLESQASKLGLDLSTGDYIDILATMGGSITNPTIKIKPVGTTDNPDLKSALKEAATGKVNAAKASVKDSVKTAVKKAERVVRDSVETIVDEVKDSVTQVLDKEVEKAKDQAKEKAKEIIKETAGKVVTDSVQQKLEEKAEEILGDKAQEEVDKIKDKLNDFNPFKKKKKDK